jgi:hypothetical protein
MNKKEAPQIMASNKKSVFQRGMGLGVEVVVVSGSVAWVLWAVHQPQARRREQSTEGYGAIVAGRLI